MLLFRSLLFVTLHAITAIIFSVISLVVWPLPFRWRYKVVSQWALLNLWLLKVICGIRYEVEGREKIPDDPCIIMAKHQSTWETLALQAVFPPQVWVLKRELLWIPFFGWGLASLNPIAIDRGAGRKALNQVIEQGRARLNSGAWVVIFPEGTRIPTGQIGKFGMGGAFLAAETGYPVVPVAHDAGKAWPRHGFLKYPGVIKLVIGDKIEMSQQTQKASDINKHVYQWMEGQMTNLEGKKPDIAPLTKDDNK
ncbi:MAG: lysophospholipid acyltransferase family protein [Nitratireductor sp.]